MNDKVLNYSTSAVVDNMSTMDTQIWSNRIFRIIIALIFIVTIAYIHRKQIQSYLNKQWIKILIKMGKIKIRYISIDELIRGGRLEDYYNNTIVVIDHELMKTDPTRKEFDKYKYDIEMRLLNSLLNEMDTSIKNEDVENTVRVKNSIEKIVKTYNGPDKNVIVKEYDNQCNLLKALILKKDIEQIKSLIRDEKWADAIRKFEELKSNHSIKETADINGFLTKSIENKVQTAIDSEDIETLSNILSILVETLVYKDSEFVQYASQEAETLVERIISSNLDEFLFNEAESYLNLYKKKCWFSPKLRNEIQKRIITRKESKEAQKNKVLIEFKDAIQKENIKIAEEKLAQAEELNNGQLIETARLQLKELRALIQNKRAFEDVVLQIRKALDRYDSALGTKLLKEVKNNPEKDDALISELETLVKKVDNALRAEQEFNGPQYLVRIKGFNVPKKVSYGEDADPYDCVDANKSWGVISVFDGMGGAGARKYVHDETQEEHTSAYWASRFVYSAVKELIEERNTKHIGENPISFIETHLHQQIKDKLDTEIAHFPSASSTMSKMIRKLPTTMAMCAYEIKDGIVHTKTYWAGDSRIYMFDLEGMSFLTIDDADAPDNDPFSPVNMDLTMNNAISQERPFRINKYEIDIPLDKEKPFVLMACSDGCFGYFKNPIEFEQMVRSELLDAKNWDEWSDRMRGAIIRNGQSDDLSMVAVTLGVESTSFDNFKQRMQARLSNPIFEAYQLWKNKNQLKQNDLSRKVGELTEEVSRLSEERDKKKEFDDKVRKIDECLNSVGIVPDFLKEEFLEKVKARGEVTDSLSNIETQIEEERTTLVELKSSLEELQLKLQDENNDWYEKYKKLVSYIVEPLTVI